MYGADCKWYLLLPVILCSFWMFWQFLNEKNRQYFHSVVYIKENKSCTDKTCWDQFFVLQTFEGDYFSTLVVWKWTFSRLIVVALVWCDLYSLIISPDLVKKKNIIIRCPLLTQTDMFMHEKVFFTSKLMDCLALMVMKWYLIM